MKAERLEVLKQAVIAAVFGATALVLGTKVVIALASGEITGRGGRLYVLSDNPEGFWTVVLVTSSATIGGVFVAALFLWVLPSVWRGERLLTRRLTFRHQTQQPVRAEPFSSRPSVSTGAEAPRD